MYYFKRYSQEAVRVGEKKKRKNVFPKKKENIPPQIGPAAPI